jgi:hypothetical protein
MRAAAAVIATLFFAATEAAAGDVAIVPSLVELTVLPGEDHTTVVQIHYTKDGPADTQPVRVMLDTENWSMNTAGDLAFTPDDVPFSAKPWIVFSPGEAEIDPGEMMNVRVSVIVPEGTASGEYRAALIAQPRTPFRPLTQGDRRLELICRLATIIYVQVPPVVGDVEFGSLQVTRLDGRYHVVPRFHNRGAAHLRVYDSFEVLPLAEAPSTTTCQREEQEAGVILPGRSRQFVHVLPCDLAPGWYQLIYRADVGKDLPLQEGETTFVISPNDGDALASTEPAEP